METIYQINVLLFAFFRGHQLISWSLVYNNLKYNHNLSYEKYITLYFLAQMYFPNCPREDRQMTS